jgi:hypothetical protein
MDFFFKTKCADISSQIQAPGLILYCLFIFLIRFIINKTIKILFNLTIVFKYDYDFYGNINNIL